MEEPPCTGICDEWIAIYMGMECLARHKIESAQEDRYIEMLEQKCGDKPAIRSQGTLLLPRAERFVRMAIDAGFKQVMLLKPFTLQTT